MLETYEMFIYEDMNLNTNLFFYKCNKIATTQTKS